MAHDRLVFPPPAGQGFIETAYLQIEKHKCVREYVIFRRVSCCRSNLNNPLNHGLLDRLEPAGQYSRVKSSAIATRGGPRNSDNRVRWKNDCRRRRPRDEEKQTEPVFGGVQGQGSNGGAPGGGDAFRAVLPI